MPIDTLMGLMMIRIQNAIIVDHIALWADAVAAVGMGSVSAFLSRTDIFQILRHLGTSNLIL